MTEPRVVVVTGASSGVGRATALAFARQGASLVLAARSEVSLRGAERECLAAGGTTLVVVADVLDEASVSALAAAAVARFGRIDVWVHSAAVVAYGRFEDVPSADFRQVLDVGIHGCTYVARTALRQFRVQEAGTLIFVGSLLGEIAIPYMSSYVTSKWALRGLARVLSIETRDAPRIHVCLVAPGGVDTPVYLQAANYAGRVGRPPPPIDSPDKVARAVLRCARRPRARVTVGMANALVRTGFAAFPRVYDALVTPLMRAGGLSRQPVSANVGNVFRPQPSGDATYGRWGRHWLRPVGVAAAALGAGAAVVLARGARQCAGR